MLFLLFVNKYKRRKTKGTGRYIQKEVHKQTSRQGRSPHVRIMHPCTQITHIKRRFQGNATKQKQLKFSYFNAFICQLPHKICLNSAANFTDHICEPYSPVGEPYGPCVWTIQSTCRTIELNTYGKLQTRPKKLFFFIIRISLYLQSK